MTATDRALPANTDFAVRHIGPDDRQIRHMLATVGAESLTALVDGAMPSGIRDHSLELPPAATEDEVTAELTELAGRNRLRRSLIGMGYYGTSTPAVIRRNVLENPAWYTAYTPYQPEISQGRLQALLMFQTMVADLTGLPLANSSLLDEPTAAAEAMSLVRRLSRAESRVFLIDVDTHPQTRAVVETRAEAIDIDVVGFDPRASADLPECFGALISYPSSTGAVWDPEPTVAALHEAGALVAVATDLLALTLLRSPGEFGADVAVGSAQRFGVPMGFGGPHAAFIAARESFARSLPGRIVGVSQDAAGRPAYRLALQTREQHIRRERATSNICTSQVLLAVVAAMYAAYHGPQGLVEIAEGVHARACRVAAAARAAGWTLRHAGFFDTVCVERADSAEAAVLAARQGGVDLRAIDSDTLCLSIGEDVRDGDIEVVLAALGAEAVSEGDEVIAPSVRRGSQFLTHPWFHEYRNETAMMRFLRRLSDADLALDRSMIPLGSCTMKLNAAVEMEPITWPAFADLHPFAPADESEGTVELIRRLEVWLAEVTGYDAVSVQPNAGSQGELAGLLAIRAYHRDRGESRDICLIPSSAHGTNAASAVMAGFRVVVVPCDDGGNVDEPALRRLLDEHADAVAALMITYPSTHGVYEAQVERLCADVHAVGGQVYLDGANLNALVGWARPGRFGADVSHLNLHKTFCIPHGGGGPGVGPVAVREHLARYLPGHPLRPDAGPAGRGWRDGGVGPVSGAPWGSAGVLPIPYAYVRLMGAEGLRRATAVAILSANYVAQRLRPHYPVLYSGPGGRVAHECILDLRGITRETGVTVDDVAKRLIDYGFHAPTMSFPVSGTLMVEPTESEDLRELDRFIDAMIAIRAEIEGVAAGTWTVAESPLRSAPHTAADLAGDWERPYSRDVAVFPSGVGAEDGGSSLAGKYWPPVGRIDGAYGDRHLACACPPVHEYAETDQV